MVHRHQDHFLAVSLRVFSRLMWANWDLFFQTHRLPQGPHFNFGFCRRAIFFGSLLGTRGSKLPRVRYLLGVESNLGATSGPYPARRKVPLERGVSFCLPQPSPLES